MLHIVTIIGARPQIIKAAAISRAIRLHHSKTIKETIVHTGQHYDENMSRVFFDELGVPNENYNLEVGSGSHGAQTASMISGIENILLDEQPDAVVVYGDTNSTLAGAIAASKLRIPVVHVEAGLRSFNREMPEEINRVLCDHVSTLLFTPTKAGIDNLIHEGIDQDAQPKKATPEKPAVYHCGDVMYDNSIFFSKMAEQKSKVLSMNGLEGTKYILATIHRDSNTDVSQRLRSIFAGLKKTAKKHGMKVVLPLHPRTKKCMARDPELRSVLMESDEIIILPPVTFFDMIALEKNATIIMTDSGGVQKEAFFFRRPCVILRNETEWVELVDCEAAILADADEERIVAAADDLLSSKIDFPEIFGDGRAAEFICKEMIRHLGK